MNKERLKIIETHLRVGKLGHDKFDFGCINMERSGEPAVNVCGTLGCAMGEFPIIFPEDWKFNSEGGVTLITESNETNDFIILSDQIQRYLDISEPAIDHLFFPFGQQTELYGGKKLNGEASKEDVANNIAKFIVKTSPKDE